MNMAIKKKFTKGEDDLIMFYWKLYGSKWTLISKFLPERNPHQIRERFLTTLDPDMKRSLFTLEEDENLFFYAEIYNQKWKNIVHFFPGRNSIQLKNRYRCLKGKNNIKKMISFINIDELTNLIC
jgi:hypothetical protein